MAKEELLRINKFFLSFMAMYPIKKEANLTKKLLFYFWRTICITFMCLLCIQIIIQLVKKDSYDLIELTDNIINIGWNTIGNFIFFYSNLMAFFLGLFIAAVIRVGYFYINSKKLKTILDNLDNFQMESEIGVYKTATLKNWIKITKYFSYVWYFNLFLTVEFMVILPLLFMKTTGRFVYQIRF